MKKVLFSTMFLLGLVSNLQAGLSTIKKDFEVLKTTSTYLEKGQQVSNLSIICVGGYKYLLNHHKGNVTQMYSFDEKFGNFVIKCNGNGEQ